MIYFIQDTHSKAIKIGVSKTPLARMADLQTAHHAKLILIGMMDGMQTEEKALHRKFTRLQGEWFEPTADLLRFVRESTVSLAHLSPPLAPPQTTIPHRPVPLPVLRRVYLIRDTMILVATWIMFAAIVGIIIYWSAITIMPLLPRWAYAVFACFDLFFYAYLARDAARRLSH